MVGWKGVAEPLVAAVTEQMLSEVDDLAVRIAEIICVEEPAYTLVPREQLVAGNRANMVAILRQVSGLDTPGLSTPRETGLVRAGEGVPLESVLRAYRLGASFIWDELIQRTRSDHESSAALLRYASTIWTLVDDYSEALTAAYRTHEAEQERRDAQAREAALDALLSGQAAARARQCATVLRLPVQGTFVVVVAAETVQHRRGSLGFEDKLAVKGVRSAWRVELDSRIGVVALPDHLTLEESCTLIGSVAKGRVGVSDPIESLSDVPDALQGARLACAAARAGTVSRYGDEPAALLLLGDPVLAGRVVDKVLGPVLALRPDEAEVLIETLESWYAGGGVAGQAAIPLHCHPNTVRYRLAKVERLTGRSLTVPLSVAELHLALEAYRVLRRR